MQTNLINEIEKKILHRKWFTYDHRISKYFHNTPKKRIREMLRANNTKAKDTYMEQIRQQVRRKRKTTLRKMRSMYKQKDTRMDIQTG